MGHIRLGILPKTRRWREVVSLLEQDGTLGEIAEASFKAAESGLLKAPKDQGFVSTLLQVLQFAVASGARSPLERLKAAGFDIGGAESVLDLAGAFRQRADQEISKKSSKSDLSEIAQTAFCETLINAVSSRQPALFGSDKEGLSTAVSESFRGERLKVVMHEFYSRFTRRYLSYYLSRELSNHVGPDKRFLNIKEHSEFDGAFDLYVRQSVRIVDEFSPAWLSKTLYQSALDDKSVSRYAHAAFRKIRSEFIRGGA